MQTPENFVNLLYKKTRLEDTFGVNMLAIYNGRSGNAWDYGKLSRQMWISSLRSARRKYD